VVTRVSVTVEVEKEMKAREEEVREAISVKEVIVTKTREEKDLPVAVVADLAAAVIVAVEAVDLVAVVEHLAAQVEAVDPVKNRPEIEKREVVKKRTFAPLF